MAVWQSSLDKSALYKRARLMSGIRQFFCEKQVLEVDVPVLGSTTGTDPHLEAIQTEVGGKKYYLQTSPEYFLKRMLAGGAGSIYFLGKAFRHDELGRRHNPEFTMLEWYRQGFDDQLLMKEVSELFAVLAPEVGAKFLPYGEIFTQVLGVCPHKASSEELQAVAATRLDVRWQSDDKNTWLDLLFSHFIEPDLRGLTFIYDYPASQCALAKVSHNEDGIKVAKRFEVFWKGVELANGYWELTDHKVQSDRFQQDLLTRSKMGLPLPEIDEKFLLAMEYGIPECAGVALGVDRLFMCLHDIEDIGRSMAFPFNHV